MRRPSVRLAIGSVLVGGVVLAGCGPSSGPAPGRASQVSQEPPSASVAADAVPGVPVPASVVREGIASGLAGLTSARANIAVVDFPTPQGQRGEERAWRWARTAQGDYHIARPGHFEFAYDAAKRVSRRIGHTPARAFLTERTDLAPGLPDNRIEREDRADPEVVARAVLRLASFQATEVDVRGRPSWLVQASHRYQWGPGPIGTSEHLSATIDRATGLAVAVVMSSKGAPVFEMQATGLTIDQPMPANQFTPVAPPGSDEQPPLPPGVQSQPPPELELPLGVGPPPKFRPVRVEEVAGAVGYKPLSPGSVPTGYRLTDVAVADQNPIKIVSMTYRRGFDTFTVTTRLRAGDPGSTSREALFLHRDAPFPAPEVVKLAGGAFAGAEALLRTEAFAPPAPHLWAVTADLVLTIAGDLTRSEFLAVAEGIR